MGQDSEQDQWGNGCNPMAGVERYQAQHRLGWDGEMEDRAVRRKVAHRGVVRSYPDRRRGTDYRQPEQHGPQHMEAEMAAAVEGGKGVAAPLVVVLEAAVLGLE